MEKSAYTRLMGLGTIATLAASSCSPKEVQTATLGVTESSAKNVASEVCGGFISSILDKSVIERDNLKRQEEVLKVCRNILEEASRTGSGPKRFLEAELAYPIAFSIMNELGSASGTGAPWGAEGAGLTKDLVGEMLEHGDELQTCVIGSSPECK